VTAAASHPTASVEEIVTGRGAALDDPTEAYQEASRSYPGIVDPLVRGAQLLERSEELRASAARSVKRHRGAPTVALPRPNLGDLTLADALAARRSERSYGQRPLTLGEVASVLASAYGVSGAFRGTEQRLRVAPSGGALYPLELYVVVRSVEVLTPGVYHYDPLRHLLERLEPLDMDALRSATPYPELLCPSAAVVVVTAMFWRSRFKYGARAYRFTLLEAGHVAQNLLLSATALRLTAVPVGGFFDRRMDAVVGADGLYEASLYVLPIGPSPA
jgi:SagB-type dehydrogenase family enzyme